MSKKDVVDIFITQDKLQALARYELRWDDIAGEDFALHDYIVETEYQYPMTLDDLRAAVTEFIDSNIPLIDFLLLWWYPITNYLYDALCLRDIMTPNSWDLVNAEAPSIPVRDEDLLFYCFTKLASGETLPENRDPSEFFHVNAKELILFDEILESLNGYLETKELPIEERTYSRLQMIDFVSQWDNDMMLSDAPEPVKNMFKRFIDTLCDMNVFNAIKIKAYALYGGNSVYPCNWAKSAELLEVLWKDFGFSYAANTLGYIYYYGRLDPNGKPDYERAFYYYSIGSTYGIYESKYKLADMFMDGKFVKRNVDLAKDIIMDLYSRTRREFEDENYGSDFADVALRMGNLFTKLNEPLGPDVNLFLAYLFTLQAKFAVQKRIETEHLWTDNEVQKKIDRRLYALRDNVKHANKTYKDTAPGMIRDYLTVSYYSTYKVTFKELKSGNVSIKIVRDPVSGRPLNSLVVLPWFDIAYLTDTFSFTAGKVHEFYRYDDGVKSIRADHISLKINDDNSYSVIFLDGTNVLAEINASECLYTRPKQESLLPGDIS